MEDENKATGQVKENSPYHKETDAFFLVTTVEDCWIPELKPIFQTLLLQKKVSQQDLADFLNLDKGYISRMVNGLLIPPLRVRLKVASYFGVDSALIWRIDKDKMKEVKQNDKESNEVA